MIADIIILAFILLLSALVVVLAINLLARPAGLISGGAEDTYDPYWIISSRNGLDYTSMIESLASRGVYPYPDTEDYIKNGELLRVERSITIPRRIALSLMHTSEEFGGVDPNTYSIKSYVKNEHDILSIQEIKNKFYLHRNLPEFVAKSWPLDEFNFTEGIFILRPAHLTACGGLDIFVVTCPDELAAARKFYDKKIERHKKSKTAVGRDYKVLVSEYITDPLLIDGKKFHIRLHGITVSGECKFKILRTEGYFLTAELPYVKADWLNKDIHDTHFGSTHYEYYYPKDFPEPSYLPRLEKFLDDIEIAMSKHITCESYSESIHSYNIYGVDIMVDSAGKPYLIEVNSRPGLERHDKEATKVTSKIVCDWIWENIQHFFIKK